RRSNFDTPLDVARRRVRREVRGADPPRDSGRADKPTGATDDRHLRHEADKTRGRPSARTSVRYVKLVAVGGRKSAPPWLRPGREVDVLLPVKVGVPKVRQLARADVGLMV